MNKTWENNNNYESMKFNALQFMNLLIQMHLDLDKRTPYHHNA